MKKNRFKGDEDEIKFSLCEVICPDRDRGNNQLTYREAYKLRKATVSIREAKYQPV
jgi:hypothetical protein